MVSVKILKNRNGYVGFKCSGHAGSADYGKDLVCCATSVLVINTINSIEKLTDTEFDCDTDEKKGIINFTFKSEVSEEASLLIDSLIIGIEGLVMEYKKYVRLEIKEV